MSAPENTNAAASTDAAAVPATHSASKTTARFDRLGLLLFLAIVFVAPAAFLRFNSGGEFDQAPLDRLNSLQPEFVFIGNSMLETRIDPVYLTHLLDGRVAISLAVLGSQSAIWYLQLKNLVAASDVPPRTVFVFFREDLITRPLEALDGRNHDVIESLLQNGDEEFGDVIGASRSAHQSVVAALQDIYPVQFHGPAALNGLSEAAAAPFPSSRQELSARADDAFAFHNLRERSGQKPPTEAATSFTDAVSSSFLPPMLEIASGHAIEIVFVRLQARPNDDGSQRQSESMSRYSADLASYLQARGVGYVDFTGNPAVNPALYYDSFHIRERYLQDYTELFLREMSTYFDDAVDWTEGGQGR